MASYDLIISGGRVLTSQGIVPADVAIAGERIAAIGSPLGSAAERLNVNGLLILPGLVDPHVHPIHAENYSSLSKAAAFGGVTTLLHHLYADPAHITDSLRHARAEADATSMLDYSFHVRLGRHDPPEEEIADLIQRGVTSFKMFMAYRDRSIMVEDSALFNSMRRIERTGGIALVHAENGAIIDILERDAKASGRTHAEHYAATRPRWAETEAVFRAMTMARITNCPLYIVHTTCVEALALEAQAKVDGVPVYVETCPHYLLLTEEAMAAHGARAKMAPPLRVKRDAEALWHGLRSGLVDAIGSDHSAFSPDEKEGFDHDISGAGLGVPGIEQMFSLLYDRGVRHDRISLPRLVELMSTKPAQIFGLSSKGAIRMGGDADLVLFDPERSFVVEANSAHGHAYYSLYEGWTGKGSISTVLQRGKFIVRDGECLAGPGQGRFVARLGRRDHLVAPTIE